MDRQQIRAFLERVANEPSYRLALETEPLQTLTNAGFEVTEEDIPPGGIKLPSNEDLNASLDSLAEDIESLHWHRLE